MLTTTNTTETETTTRAAAHELGCDCETCWNDFRAYYAQPGRPAVDAKSIRAAFLAGTEVIRSERSLRAAARASGALLVLLTAAACTSLGRPDVEAQRSHSYGEPVVQRLCMVRDAGVWTTHALAITEALQAEFKPYGIEIDTVSLQTEPRPGFTAFGLLDSIASKPLPEYCDRMLLLVSRGWADRLWSAVGLPEALGAVTEDGLRGYVVAVPSRFSLNQLASGGPTEVAKHEFYHMLGCQHAALAGMGGCYARIAEWKQDVQREEALSMLGWTGPTYPQ